MRTGVKWEHLQLLPGQMRARQEPDQIDVRSGRRSRIWFYNEALFLCAALAQRAGDEPIAPEIAVPQII